MSMCPLISDGTLVIHRTRYSAAPTSPIEEARGHLERLGVEVELGPVERLGAKGIGASVYFRDPDGSLLEFISYGEESEEA